MGGERCVEKQFHHSRGRPDAVAARGLVSRNRLSAGSPFVQELRTKLQAYMKVSGSEPDTPAEQLPRFTPQLQNKPATDLERVIAGAIQAGLETN
jgi:hypothetical protein